MNTECPTLQSCWMVTFPKVYVMNTESPTRLIFWDSSGWVVTFLKVDVAATETLDYIYTWCIRTDVRERNLRRSRERDRVLKRERKKTNKVFRNKGWISDISAHNMMYLAAVWQVFTMWTLFFWLNFFAVIKSVWYLSCDKIVSCDIPATACVNSRNLLRHVSLTASEPHLGWRLHICRLHCQLLLHTAIFLWLMHSK